jgi:hypothetical protein
MGMASGAWHVTISLCIRVSSSWHLAIKRRVDLGSAHSGPHATLKPSNRFGVGIAALWVY